MIYCTLFNPAVDVVYHLGEVSLGNTQTDLSAEALPAGKGINVAKVVAALGEKACVLGLMPRFDKDRFVSYLHALGIDSRFFEVDGGARICSTLIEQDSMQVTHLNSHGGSYSPRIQDEFLSFLEPFISEGDSWALSGSLPQGFESDAYMKLSEKLRASNIAVSLDTRGPALSVGVRARPLIVKPNLTELEAFFGEHIEGVHHIALKAKRLVDLGVSQVYVTLGSDGMIAVRDNECLLCQIPPVIAVDTVGCGDAVVAGLIVGNERKFSFSETCRMAVACGVSNAMHPGPGNVSRDEVWQLMEDVRIEAV